MADGLSNYRTGDAFDEMMDAEGSVRPSQGRRLRPQPLNLRRSP